MRLADNLKLLRQRKGLTQDEVAKAVGVTRKTYASWERGVAPRKDVYKKLTEVLECDLNDLFHYGDNVEVDLKGGAILGAVGAGTAAAIAAATGSGPIGIAGGLMYGFIRGFAAGPKKITIPGTSETAVNDEEDATVTAEQAQDIASDYELHQRKFQALSVGLLYQALASSGVAFRPPVGNQDSDGIANKTGVVINLDNERFKSWHLLFYASDTKLSEKLPLSASAKAEVLLSQLIIKEPDKETKTSIVVDDDEVYDELQKFKGRNSYRGYLSTVLVNTREVRLAKEEFISLYEDHGDWEDLPKIV